MDQRPGGAPGPKREILVSLFLGGALLVVGSLLPLAEFPRGWVGYTVNDRRWP